VSVWQLRTEFASGLKPVQRQAHAGTPGQTKPLWDRWGRPEAKEAQGGCRFCRAPSVVGT
jgi:hypothetical protein